MILFKDFMYWLAPETLRAMEFTTNSDVWSFACTVWEMFTRGQTPYGNCRCWNDILTSIDRGLVPPRPESMSRQGMDSTDFFGVLTFFAIFDIFAI